MWLPCQFGVLSNAPTTYIAPGGIIQQAVMYTLSPSGRQQQARRQGVPKLEEYGEGGEQGNPTKVTFRTTFW